MKPPLRQIANQLSKVEVSWPATLPLPRIAPLMNKVASMVPDLPSPASRIWPASLPGPSRADLGGMITDINQLNRPLPGLNRLAAAPTPATIPSEPIFESVIETVGSPAADFSRIMRLDFE